MKPIFFVDDKEIEAAHISGEHLNKIINVVMNDEYAISDVVVSFHHYINKRNRRVVELKFKHSPPIETEYIDWTYSTLFTT